MRESEIRKAAAELFLRKGFEAATMRDIAREVGIEAPSLYNHFPSKQDLLAAILVATMEEVISFVRGAVAEAGPGAPAQLRAAITAYVLYHSERLTEASISDTERRSLRPEDLGRVHELRRELGKIFKDIIRRGVRAQEFAVSDVSVAALCVLSICARLPVWYRPDGRHDLETVARLFSDFALEAVGGSA